MDTDIKYALYYYGRYIPLIRSNGTMEMAIDAALEYMWRDEGFDRDMDFHIIEIAKISKFNTDNYDEYFAKKAEEEAKQIQQRQEARDKQDYERLKKRFEK